MPSSALGPAQGLTWRGSRLTSGSGGGLRPLTTVLLLEVSGPGGDVLGSLSSQRLDSRHSFIRLFPPIPDLDPAIIRFDDVNHSRRLGGS